MNGCSGWPGGSGPTDRRDSPRPRPRTPDPTCGKVAARAERLPCTRPPPEPLPPRPRRPTVIAHGALWVAFCHEGDPPPSGFSVYARLRQGAAVRGAPRRHRGVLIAATANGRARLNIHQHARRRSCPHPRRPTRPHRTARRPRWTLARAVPSSRRHRPARRHRWRALHRHRGPPHLPRPVRRRRCPRRVFARQWPASDMPPAGKVSVTRFGRSRRGPARPVPWLPARS
jgi:hypothetical protein